MRGGTEGRAQQIIATGAEVLQRGAARIRQARLAVSGPDNGRQLIEQCEQVETARTVHERSSEKRARAEVAQRKRRRMFAGSPRLHKPEL